MNEIDKIQDPYAALFLAKWAKNNLIPKDGVGIKSITTKDKKLYITLTDGTVKKFDMPSITINSVGGGINYYALNNIPEPLLNDDEFMIFRNGTPYKVKLSVLNGYFGNELPINTMTDINGQGYTDLDGSYYTTI